MDYVMIFLQVLLVLILAVNIFAILWMIYDWQKINLFFKRNAPARGVVKGYTYVPAHTTLVTQISNVGKCSVPTTRNAYHPAEYKIHLMCKNNGIRFMLTYDVPKSHYKKYKIGEAVFIDADWFPCNYSIENKKYAKPT